MKYTLYVLALCLSFTLSTVSAQGWEITPYTGGAADVVESTNGDYYVTGQWDDSPGDSLTRSHIARIGPDGALKWIKALKGRKGEKIIQLRDGHLLICSSFSGIPERGLLLQKVDQGGTLLWSKEIELFFFNEPAGLLETRDGAIYLSGAYRKRYENGTASEQAAFLLKFDGSGNQLFSKEFDNNIYHYKDIKELPDGNLILDTRGAEQALVLDPNGNVLQTYVLGIDFNIDRAQLFPTDNGGFVMVGGTHPGDVFILKAGAEGSLIYSRTFPTPDFESVLDATATPDGGYAITGWRDGNIFVYRLSAQGEQLWEKEYGLTDAAGTPNQQAPGDIDATLDGGLIIAGTTSSPNRAYLIKMDGQGNVYDNLITGRVFFDENLDCELLENMEIGLSDWIVKAESDNYIAYAVSDGQGEYSLALPTGTYTISLPTDHPFWQECSTYTAELQVSPDTQIIDLALQAQVDCPLLEVNISTDRLRRCTSNAYQLSYCNRGTLQGEDVYIEVAFDEHMSVDSAQIDFTSLGNNLYRFSIGDLPISTCGSFLVYTSLGCDPEVDLGQIHCAEANIYPETNCLPADERWDGVNIVATGNCLGDSIIFKLTNEGEKNMPGPLEYVVIQDQIILKNAPFQLDSDDSLRLAFLATGSTFALFAQQSKFLAGNTYPGVTVEGCGGLTPGYSRSIPDNDTEPNRSVFCLENRDSYDPNDKQAALLGIGPDHLIAAGTELEYLIRFQNTGNDTAYQVVIRDTLSSFLNIASVQILNASHSYRWKIEGSNILVFTFENILLPDSTANEIASQGFISYQVRQVEGLTEGTVIMNSAAIYFDFNQAVQTNTVRHTIGGIFQGLINPAPTRPAHTARIKVFPNPAVDQVRFELEGSEDAPVLFRLYNAYGQLIRTEKRYSPFTFDCRNLPNGLYFYEIQCNGKAAGAGNLVLAN